MSLTLYGVLGVDRTATAEEIKAAYRAKASAAHPDRGGSHEAMAALTVAYDVVGHEAKRAAYDAQLALLGTPCAACDGEGRRWRQKGFSSRVPVSCKACSGEGYTAVKAVKVVPVTGTGPSKKRRVKK